MAAPQSWAHGAWREGSHLDIASKPQVAPAKTSPRSSPPSAAPKGHHEGQAQTWAGHTREMSATPVHNLNMGWAVLLRPQCGTGVTCVPRWDCRALHSAGTASAALLSLWRHSRAQHILPNAKMLILSPICIKPKLVFSSEVGKTHSFNVKKMHVGAWGQSIFSEYPEIPAGPPCLL